MFMDVCQWGGGDGTTDEKMGSKQWEKGHETGKQDEQGTGEEHGQYERESQESQHTKKNYIWSPSPIRSSFKHSPSQEISVSTPICCQHWFENTHTRRFGSGHPMSQQYRFIVLWTLFFLHQRAFSASLFSISFCSFPPVADLEILQSYQDVTQRLNTRSKEISAVLCLTDESLTPL